ncbi:hypothetical protein RCH13_002554 [Chryseobacterium sp. MP_3.2]|nr:hypothetical protein [Chryseobacterium sp. MP_3.2]
MKKRLLIQFLAIFFLLGCTSKKKIVQSKFYEENINVNLYAFVGEKISVERFDPNKNNTKKIKDPNSTDSIIIKEYVMDYGFNSTYKILQNVYNSFETDTIVFKAYDHYGNPAFKNEKYVLLYVSKSANEGYYHVKYQFDSLKKTKFGFKGYNGKSIERLFTDKKNTVLKERKLFD